LEAIIQPFWKKRLIKINFWLKPFPKRLVSKLAKPVLGFIKEGILPYFLIYVLQLCLTINNHY